MKPTDTTTASEDGDSEQQSKSHIPQLQRSVSLRIKGDKTHVLSRNSCSRNSITEKILSKTSPENLKRSYKYPIENGLRGRTPSESALMDDDKTSVKSFGSCASFASCDITTINRDMNLSYIEKSRSQKYVLHCQHKIQTPEKYLTPTQRKDREIRLLKASLADAHKRCDAKEAEITRLKSELKTPTDISSIFEPTEDFNIPLSENENTEQKKEEKATKQGDLNSLEDSGIMTDFSENPKYLSKKHEMASLDEEDGLGKRFENYMQESQANKFYQNLFASLSDQYRPPSKSLSSDDENTPDINFLRKINSCNQTKSNGAKEESWFLNDDKGSTNFNARLHSKSSAFSHRKASLLSDEAREILIHYEKEIEEMNRHHAIIYQGLKEKYTDRIEILLQKLSEANSRYMELRPAYDRAQDRIRQMEIQLESMRKEISAQEEWHSQMYLKMYRKGQEAAKFEHADEVLEFAHRAPKRVSVPELLQQLHRTENELETTKEMYRCELYSQSRNGNERHSEYTLRFLKDAMYYFLTEKDNKGHLQAIESILGFNDSERAAVLKALKLKRI